MVVLKIINLILGIIFTLCYFYQFIYLFVAYLGKKEVVRDAPPSRLAVLIAARNESAVIQNLLNSLNAQDYPKDFYKVFLVADNCTDNTAEIARAHGAIVYERFNNVEKGKGYAIDYLIKCAKRDFGDGFCDAYVVFDADNVANDNYLTEINKTFSLGCDVVTSYRAATNYGANWRSAGQGMYFLRETRVLNLARTRLGTNTFVTGTGFLFSYKLCEENGGWPFHLLTEDGEFTMNNAVNGVKTKYCNTAIFYDEQATKMKTSWNQQLRWCKGGLQIFKKYLPQLLRGIFSKKIVSCFDMMMCLTPAYILSLSAIAVNVISSAILIAKGSDPLQILSTFAIMILVLYCMLMAFCIPITISEWKLIRATAAQKIFYAFTFPLYLFSFVPAAFVALFKKVEWKAIAHEGADASQNEKASK